jgi:hypothetical protein
VGFFHKESVLPRAPFKILEPICEDIDLLLISTPFLYRRGTAVVCMVVWFPTPTYIRSPGALRAVSHTRCAVSGERLLSSNREGGLNLPLGVIRDSP